MTTENNEVPLRSINKTKLVAAEGKEEVYFLTALKDNLEITNVEIRDIGGTYGLPTKLNTLIKTPGFSNVVSFGVMIDANSNASNAFKSVCEALRSSCLAVPAEPLKLTKKDKGQPQVMVLIVPHGADQGMLEDICLQSVANDPAMTCVEEYFECLMKNLDKSPRNPSKARVHAFLSSRELPEKRLGEAAKAGYWPWDSQAFDHVKQFLSML